MSGVLGNGISQSPSTSSIWACFGCCRNRKKPAGKLEQGQSVVELTPARNSGESELDKTVKAVASIIELFPELKAGGISHAAVAQGNETSPEIVKAVVRLLEELPIQSDAKQVTARVIAKRIVDKTLTDLAEPLREEKEVLPQAVVVSSPKKEVAPIEITLTAISAAAETAPTQIPEQKEPEVSKPVKKEESKPKRKTLRGTRELRALGIDPEKVVRVMQRKALRDLRNDN